MDALNLEESTVHADNEETKDTDQSAGKPKKKKARKAK